MKYKLLQLILIGGIITCFFLPMFNVDSLKLTGIEAIFSKDILLFGNIILGFILLTTIAHLIYMVISLFKQNVSENFLNASTIIVNLSLIAGLLMITFLGWYTNIIAIVCVVLMIASAYVSHKLL